MDSYWQLYNRLIAEAKEDEVIRKVFITPPWTFVLTDKGHIGTAMTLEGQLSDPEKFTGMTLRNAAEMVKSWNFALASIGLAAINASLNRHENFPEQKNPDAFLRYRNLFSGKNVVIVGHFSYLEEKLKGLCDLTVLERQPSGNDLPDPACEYVLPDADVAIITGSAIINKTMPRLLDLSGKAFTIISGPSTPMTEILFDYGVNAACGFCITDSSVILPQTEKEHPAETKGSIFRYGKMVCAEHF